MAPKELGVALQVRAGEVRRCFNRALKDNPDLEGRVVLAVRIAEDGSVCSATTLQSDMPRGQLRRIARKS